MVTTQELYVVLVGLTLYLLGAVSPNHHPEKSRKAFGYGVSDVIKVAAVAFLLPKILRFSIGETGGFTEKAALVGCIVLFSAGLVAVRYYVAGQKIRQWTLFD